MIDKAKIQSVLQAPRARKYGVRFAVFLMAVGVLGFLILPPVVKSVLLDKLGEALHRPVAIKSISINPYALSVTLEGLEIKEREGTETFAGFDSLYLNLQSSSLFRLGPVVKEIKLVNPKFRIVRVSENRYNFSDLLDEFMAKPKEEGPPPAFSLNNIQVSGGVVEFDDRPVDERHVVSDIVLTLPFVSSMAYAAETFVEPHFSARVDDAPLEITGKSKPFSDSHESEFALALDNVQLAKYADYSPVKLPIRIDSGALDTDLKLIFRQEVAKKGEKPGNKERQMTLLLSGKATLRNLKVAEASGVPLVSFRRFDVAIGSSDLLGGKFVIDRVALDSPEINARATRSGAINWQDLLPKNQSADRQAAAPASKSAPARGVEWSLGEAKVRDGAFRWFDESNPKPFKASVEAINAGLKNLDSKGSVADFEATWKVAAEERLKVDAFAVKEGKLDLARRQVIVGDARAKGVHGLIKRSAEGEIEWIRPPVLRLAEASRKDRGDEPTWKVTVAKYVGEDVSVRFEDSAVSPSAVQSIDGLGFELDNLSTEPGQAVKVKAGFKLNRKGEVAVEGTLVPMPLDADLRVDIKTVELLPLQPFFSEKLNIDVTRGLLTVKGDVKLRQAEDGKAGGTGELSGGFSGQATIGDFYAVDKTNSADFLRWKSFYVGKADVRFGPESVSVGEVALSDFFARVIVSPEGKLNLMQIVRKGEKEEGKKDLQAVPVASEPPAVPSDGKATAPVATASKPVMPVRIGKITLQGGTVRFSDNFVKPNYTANLRQIGGHITGLSSEPGTKASLELRGSYDNVAPLNITAQINPFSAKPYLDLQADIKGIELTSLSAYSGKYAGYAIDKGKLSLFVNYRIENDQLEAENRVFLDQLTFGEPVDSPDATKLPVTLAVALLKNRAGEIDINLPISGSLNDPQFSVSGLVVKVIVNLLVKAATSPFALIGSMFGGSEELANVEFDYGRATLTPVAEKRLENLSRAMIDRPGLKMEIEGKVDLARDPEGLKRARIDRKVRALKRDEMTKKNIESGPAETLEVTAQEYPALLERAYREEKFPKPRNVIGMVKSLPVEEMEKLMLANSAVDDDDLRALGDRRAKAVRDWLLAHDVPAERVFVLPTRLAEGEDQPEAEKKARGSRADFSLK